MMDDLKKKNSPSYLWIDRLHRLIRLHKLKMDIPKPILQECNHQLSIIHQATVLSYK